VLPGKIIRVDMNTEEVGGLDVFSAQTALTYDESVLKVIAVSHEETFCGFWGVLTYSIHEGTILLAWSGMGSLEGSGPMVYIDLEVLSSAEIGQSIPLHFEYFVFNEGNPFAVTKDGAISIISAPDIVLSDTPHGFGQVAIGTTKDWKLKVTNEGIEDLVVTEVLSDNVAFTVDETAFSVSPGNSVELTVTFAPLDEAQYEGILTVLSNDPDKSECNILVTGVGVRSDPDISVSPTSCDFGQVAVHGVSETELTVSNVGTEALVVTDIDATSPDFSVDKTSFTLQPDSSERVAVTCSPSAEGTTTADLVVFSNDPDEPTVTIHLLAVGVTPDVMVSISGASGNPGTSGIKVSVLLDNRSDVAGMELVVNFDPEMLTATGISTTSRSAHIPVFITNLNYGSGKVKLLIVATDGESIAHGVGSVAEILFDIDADASLGTYPVTLSDVIVGDARGNPLLTGIENGAVNIMGSTEVEGDNRSGSMPEEFALLQNGPNPFNPTTDIRYQIPDVGYSIHIALKVYNLLGQEVATLVDEIEEPGYYSVKFDSQNLASGVYFYTLKAGEFCMTRRMALIR